MQRFMDDDGLHFPGEDSRDPQELMPKEEWELRINIDDIWDHVAGEEEGNPVIEDFEDDLNSLADVIDKANTHNLSDFDVVALRAGHDAFSDAVQEIRDLHEYIDELIGELKKARCDATSWYAGWTSGWNAQREGKSMAECPIALERFKAVIDRDPYMDYIADEVVDAMEEAVEQQNVGLRVSSEEDSLDLVDLDTGAVLRIGNDFVNYSSEFVNRGGFVPAQSNERGKVEVSPTEHFKDKHRIEQQEKLINKLENAIQQLWEDTKHD